MVAYQCKKIKSLSEGFMVFVKGLIHAGTFSAHYDIAIQEGMVV
jgi:hypothetical protein